MKKTSSFSSRIAIIGLCLLLSACILFQFSSCAAQIHAANLMENRSSKPVQEKETDEAFIRGTAEFSINLFKKSVDKTDNSLISPLSVMLALAMTANGADTTTKAQMETLLGGFSLEDLNQYLYSYVKHLPSEEKSSIRIANSIWFRDDEGRLAVEEDFLQHNADYYSASAYKAAFDEQTVSDINQWVKQKTDGCIDSIVNQIDPNTIMYLINALVFDAEWQNAYQLMNVRDGMFTSVAGTEESAKMMSSEETLYISDDMATGFMKPYKNNHYSFVALLPNRDVSIDQYVSSLTGEHFLNIVNHAESAGVNASMPKFSYEYKIVLNDALASLGIPDAFDAATADFSRMAKDSMGNIYIGEVLHKTFLSVDELGTKAGAVTKVEVKDTAALMGYTVTLDRPFVYAIIDNDTGLPLFMGTLLHLGE